MPNPVPSLEEIVARLEAAQAGLSSLDIEIAKMLGYQRVEAGQDYWVDPDDRYIGSQLPRYTESLDAALTLVPKGYAWLARSDAKRGAFANVATLDFEWDHDERPTSGARFAVYARTPALALCIAALRARQALSPTA